MTPQSKVGEGEVGMTGALVVGLGVVGTVVGLGVPGSGVGSLVDGMGVGSLVVGLDVSGSGVGCLVTGLADGNWEMDGFDVGSGSVGWGVTGETITGAGVGDWGDVASQKHSSKKDETNGHTSAPIKPSKPAVSICAQVSSG